jgi:hypothetical protein
MRPGTHHNQLHAWLCLLIALLLALIPVLVPIISLIPIISTTLHSRAQILCQYRVQAVRPGMQDSGWHSQPEPWLV